MSEAETRHRVLIVDDEPTTSETLAFNFVHHGYDAKYALTAEAVIQLTTYWVPEFAIIDVMLPGMEGIAVAIYISAKHSGCRALLFTGDMATAELLASQKEK